MSSERVLNGFLKLYLRDVSSGTRRPLAEYQALFAGNEALIAQEYARYEDGIGAGDASRPSLPHIGRYRVVEEIGRGGQGVVWLAEDEQLRRRVAIKVLTGLGSLTPDRIARFLREAEVASRLDHPGIATVYEVGMDGGMPFIAMRYVEGESIAASIAAAREDLTADPATFAVLSIPSIAETPEAGRPRPESSSGPKTSAEIVRLLSLFESAARTLHFAHESGIVHRDIKPGNIIVTKEGAPVILDFGLAQDLQGDQPTLTATGDLMGTPAYMSPEQIAGERIRVDRRTDVYSLGVSLYECLTLARPFDAPTRDGLYQAILAKDAPDPRRLNPAIPRDLRVVLEAALEKDRDRRYQTALDLAEDLRRVRTHEPVRAKPVGGLVRLGRWGQRNPALAVSVGTLLVVLAAGLATALVLLHRSEQERTLKESALAAVTLERDAKNAALEDYDRLGDHARYSMLASAADAFWPAEPSKAKAMRGWLEQADLLMRRIPEYQSALDRLRAKAEMIESAESGPASRTWKFQSPADQFKHDTIQTLVANANAFAHSKTGTAQGVRHRLEFAESVEHESIEKYALQWADAIRSIADEAVCPKYRGLRIKPQLGLIPLGRDPSSGLWEFAHLFSARRGSDPVPRRDAAGHIVFEEPLGVILVLIPGGRFMMGAVRPDEDQTGTEPNVDPDARPEEGPVGEVALDPFFMSKYELTQAQWLRMTGKAPSFRLGPATRSGEQLDLRYPLESMTWEEADLWLRRFDLLVPTEAQWEYAARGGTTTPWWTGADKSGLAGAANVADLTFHGQGGPPDYPYESWDDGYMGHSPVGTFAPNPFGLHDVIGNVWENCRDLYSANSYVFPPDEGDGLRHPRQYTHHVARGGSFSNSASNSRVTRRIMVTASLKSSDGGVRPSRDLR